MCDWKPGPRCFTHYEPRYRAALDAYSEALRKVRVLAESGKLTDADRLALQNAFEDYQAAQRMFFMSPKARKKYLGDEIAIVRENLESAKEHLAEHPDDEYAKLYVNNYTAELDQLQKQAVDGNHRWQQAKLASELAARRNENALERGIFSEATYTTEDLQDVDLNTWDRACPAGDIVLHGIDDKLQESNNPKIHREATVTRKVRIELPTGERVHINLQARIIQKKKNSSSYTVEYTAHYNGENLGTLIPNSTAQDGFYGVGAVAEHRPVTRDVSITARDGGALRKTDWEHYQKVNDLTDEELAEHKAVYEENLEEIRKYNNANKKGMYSCANTFPREINSTPRGKQHNNLTRKFTEENNAHTSFNSISAAQNDIKRVLKDQDTLITGLVVNARNKSVKDYATQQFNATDKKERDQVEQKAKEEIAAQPERLKPKTRRERRSHGGGLDRAERNTIRVERKVAQIYKEKATTTRREKSLNASNEALKNRRQKTGSNIYSTTVDPVRRPTGSKGSYSYSTTHDVKGGRKEFRTIKFTSKGKLAAGYTASPNTHDPSMITITTPQKQTVTVSRGQYATMAATGKK